MLGKSVFHPTPTPRQRTILKTVAKRTYGFAAVGINITVIVIIIISIILIIIIIIIISIISMQFSYGWKKSHRQHESGSRSLYTLSVGHWVNFDQLPGCSAMKAAHLGYLEALTARPSSFGYVTLFHEHLQEMHLQRRNRRFSVTVDLPLISFLQNEMPYRSLLQFVWTQSKRAEDWTIELKSFTNTSSLCDERKRVSKHF